MATIKSQFRLVGVFSTAQTYVRLSFVRGMIPSSETCPGAMLVIAAPELSSRLPDGQETLPILEASDNLALDSPITT